MKLNEILPVFISIFILVFVAVVQKQSKVVAAVTSTMPVTIPLSLWIVYSSTKGEHVAVEKYTQGLVTGIIPTVAFTIALWVGARLGLKLSWLVVTAYATWAVTLAAILLLKRVLGFTDI